MPWQDVCPFVRPSVRPFQRPWTIPTPSFKVTPFFDAEYLTNCTTYRRSFNEILIETYTRPTQQCHFEWPWVILSDLAKYSMTRSVARSLCDSWASCTVQSRNEAYKNDAKNILNIHGQTKRTVAPPNMPLSNGLQHAAAKFDKIYRKNLSNIFHKRSIRPTIPMQSTAWKRLLWFWSLQFSTEWQCVVTVTQWELVAKQRLLWPEVAATVKQSRDQRSSGRDRVDAELTL